MRTAFLTLLAAALVTSLCGAAAVYSGVYDVAASAPHWRATYAILETARVRSIKVHADGIVVPSGFDDPARMGPAIAHFSQHCAMCHGAPGVDRSDLAEGMYPRPPDLTNVSQRYTPAQLFWILKNGIKMSGMPSMADDGDELLWRTVGFLERLPGMSPDAYNQLRLASLAQGGHHHHDMMNMGGKPMHDGDMEDAADDPEDEDAADPPSQTDAAKNHPGPAHSTAAGSGNTESINK